MTARALAAALALTLLPAAPAAQQPRFRAVTAVVTVSVSVKRGNAAVANLKASDFTLTDSGVPQTIEAVSIESVPIDVTLFLDTSGSTAGKLDEMRQDVQSVLQLLRSEDRFRLLTIGDTVNEVVPWVPAGTKVPVAIEPVGGISLIRDALMLALVHRPEPGRRHLVVGMTDRRDCGSVVSTALLHEIAGRSEAVMHLVDYSGGGGDARYRVRGCSPAGGAARRGDAGARRRAHRRRAARPVAVLPRVVRSRARSGRSSTTSARATCCATRPKGCRRADGIRSSSVCRPPATRPSARARATTRTDAARLDLE